MSSFPSLTTARSPLLTTAIAAGLVLGAAAVAFRHHARRDDDPEANLASYLMDHLTGSDAALTVVTRLSVSHDGTPEGSLFQALALEFEAERRVVRSVLTQLGSSTFSAKRAAGYAGGVILQAAAGGNQGSLALFRTLESLLVGVQGKRCLWRALQSIEPGLEDAARFSALEDQALDQWRRIEELRQRQMPLVFGVGE